MYIGLHVKYNLFLSDFNGTCIFFERLLKIIEILNSIKIRLEGAMLFHADGRKQFCERAY